MTVRTVEDPSQQFLATQNGVRVFWKAFDTITYPNRVAVVYDVRGRIVYEGCAVVGRLYGYPGMEATLIKETSMQRGVRPETPQYKVVLGLTDGEYNYSTLQKLAGTELERRMGHGFRIPIDRRFDTKFTPVVINRKLNVKIIGGSSEAGGAVRTILDNIIEIEAQ
ncbi:MAG: hypothetical protein HY362_00705 [Candidatus Aenigmarchaeota archaeon]|nr:hypothetical protein [Candidatus Aenigmarchaeota archaeon]